MVRLDAAIAEVSAFLESLGIAHMLIGGQAVIARGVPRATLDVDMTLWVEPDELATTVEAITARFRSLTRSPQEFVIQTRVLPAQTSSGVRIDLVFASLPFERQAIRRAVTEEIGGVPVPVIAAEDLIIQKLASERPKDLSDGRALLERHAATLDDEYLVPQLRELAAALARDDIQEALDEYWPEEQD